MPPKRNKSIKDEKLEAERRAKEEEEARLICLKEEEERAKVEEAIRIQTLAEQTKIDRFKEEWRRRTKFEAERHNRYCYEKQMIDNEREWNEYLKCEDRIDVNDERAINTFLSETRDQQPTFQHFCGFCDRLRLLADDLISKMLEAKSLRRRTTSSEFGILQDQLQQRLQAELNASTNWLLQGRLDRDVTDSYKWLGTASGVALDLPGKIEIRREALTIESSSFLRIVRLPYYDGHFNRFEEENIIVGDVYQFDALQLPVNSNKGEFEGLQGAKVDSHFDFKLKIPERIVGSYSSIKVLRLDKDGQWVEDGITNVIVDATSVTFKLQQNSSATLALFQPRMEQPSFVSWSLGPMLDNERISTVQLCLETTSFELCIQVLMNGMCRLLSPALPQLQHVLGKDYTPGALLFELSKCGIHVVSSDDASAMKLKAIEEVLYEDMSFLSASFDFKPSKKNFGVDHSRVACLIRESSTFTGRHDPFPMDFLIAEIEHERIGMQIRSDDEACPSGCGKVSWAIQRGTNDESIELSECGEGTINTDFHLYPLDCLEHACAPEAFEKVKEFSPIVARAVKQLLVLVRPLKCCTASV